MRRATLLLVVLLGAIALTGCGGGEEVSPTAEDFTGPAPAATETAETETAETETTAAAEGDPTAGKAVFASAGCGACHTLADAGSSGSVGPNLDDAQPDYDLVVERVTNGMGGMPSFKDQLSAEDIQNVAAYVSSAAGR